MKKRWLALFMAAIMTVTKTSIGTLANSDQTPKEKQTVSTATLFTDVAPSAYFFEPVKWAVQNDVTKGTSATTFSPNQDCTRGQIVTFLYKASKAKTHSDIQKFEDVKPSKYYYDPVNWATAQAITSGTSSSTFSPNQSCTRAQAITFLWRYTGSPDPASVRNFKDVASSKWYYKAVNWGLEKGITAGTSETTFSPDETCTRAQIITFLYKTFNHNTDTTNDQKSSSKGNTPSKEDTPSKGDTPSKESTPSKGDTPSKEDAPSKGDTPSKEDAPSEDQKDDGSSTIITAQDNVKAFDTTSPEGLQEIASFANNIVGIHSEDNNDVMEWAVAVRNESSIMKDINDGLIKPNDILYMPANDYFASDFALKYLGHSDYTNDTYVKLDHHVDNGYKVYMDAIDENTYDPDTMEILNFKSPEDLTEVFKGDVSVATDGIDKQDPVAFTYIPDFDNDQVSTSETSQDETLVGANNLNIPDKNDVTGFHIDHTDNSATLMIHKKFDLSHICDVTLDGSLALTNLTQTPMKNYVQSSSTEDVQNGEDIPQLIANETSWNINNDISLTVSSGTDFRRAIKEINKRAGKTYNNVRHNKIFGMDYKGVDLSNSVIVGMIGFRLQPRTIKIGVKSVRNSSISLPLSPMLVILFTFDADGNMHTKIKNNYHYQEYNKYGYVFAKKTYSALPLKIGQKYQGLPQFKRVDPQNLRQYQYVYENVHQKSETDTSAPVAEYTLSGNINTDDDGITFGFSPSPCLMIAGIIPARIKPTIALNTKADLSGSLHYIGKELKDFNDIAYFYLDSLLYRKASIQARFNIGKKGDGKGFDVFNHEWSLDSLSPIWQVTYNSSSHEMTEYLGKSVEDLQKDYPDLTARTRADRIDGYAANGGISYDTVNDYGNMGKRIASIKLFSFRNWHKSNRNTIYGISIGMSLDEAESKLKKAGFFPEPYDSSYPARIYNNGKGRTVRLDFSINTPPDITITNVSVDANLDYNPGPGIELSGYVGKTKEEIMRLIPHSYVDPNTPHSICLPWEGVNILASNDNQPFYDYLSMAGFDTSCSLYGIKINSKYNDAKKILNNNGFTLTLTDNPANYKKDYYYQKKSKDSAKASEICLTVCNGNIAAIIYNINAEPRL